VAVVQCKPLQLDHLWRRPALDFPSRVDCLVVASWSRWVLLGMVETSLQSSRPLRGAFLPEAAFHLLWCRLQGCVEILIPLNLASPIAKPVSPFYNSGTSISDVLALDIKHTFILLGSMKSKYELFELDDKNKELLPWDFLYPFSAGGYSSLLEHKSYLAHRKSKL